MSPRRPTWRTCTSPWELSTEIVHVWRVCLDQAPSVSSWVNGVLSEEEKDRAGKFHFERDRRRFSVARAALRAILAGYLKTDPGKLRFRYAALGKPFLDMAGFQLSFNVSHSHELALIAVSNRSELGIDAEFIRAVSDSDGMAQCAFSPRELQALRALPEDLRQPGFFACWTRKEAYVKARGGGLSIPLDRFDVAVDPREPPTLLTAPEDPQGHSHWGMVELSPAPGYIATLVAPGQDWQCCFHDWPQEHPIVV